MPELGGALLVAAAFGTVTSTRRSVEHNRRVGGVPNSYHLVGQALDVRRRPGITHQAIDIALRRAGYVLIESLDEVDHSHFAFLGRTIPVRSSRSPVTLLAKQEKPAPSPWLADDHGVLAIDAGVLHVETAADASKAGSGLPPTQSSPSR